MQHREIPVACVQLSAHDRRGFANAWPHVLRRVDEAGESGARLIVLPEGTVPGYVLGDEPVSPDLLDFAASDLARAARRFGAVIVYGGAKIVRERTFNAAIAIGPDGRELGFAAKQFLWHFDRRWFAAGDTLDPIDTPVGRLGLLVCADGRIPSIAATLCDRGAELLVMPTAWVTSGRSIAEFENVQADYMASIRARENAVPFVAANKIGVECESVAYCGKSAIFASDGRTLARGDGASETIVRANVTLGERVPPERKQLASVTTKDVASRPTRVRVAFTARDAHDDLERLAGYARDADADLVLAPMQTAREHAVAYVARVTGDDAIHDLGAVRIASVSAEMLRSPRALVTVRLEGIDLFVWFADGDPAWHEPFARTRAAELRAYVVVFTGTARAFAVDPDGIVVAGTFGDFALASFVYDRARTMATVVAPTTDVFEGLRVAEAIAAQPAATARA